MKREVTFGKYFCGHEISSYGLENGRVDYRTLAKAFDAVMNNNIMERTRDIGYWECENGNESYCEYDGEEYTENELEEMIGQAEDELSEMENDDEEETEEYKELEEKIVEMRNAMDDIRYHEVFQYFIISDQGAEILKDYTNELVWYNEELDMYIWGITHWGTAWDNVLTEIRCNVSEEETEGGTEE